MSNTATETVVELPKTERKLNRLTDRCDTGQCGAQAFIIAEKVIFVDDEPLVGELLFCGHHGTKLTPALIEQGFEVTNNTDQVNLKPSISANAE